LTKETLCGTFTTRVCRRPEIAIGVREDVERGDKKLQLPPTGSNGPPHIADAPHGDHPEGVNILERKEKQKRGDVS